MADVNVLECDSLMATPTLESNTKDQKVYKKKNLSWWFRADKISVPRQSPVTLGQNFLSAPHTHERLLYSYAACAKMLGCH